MIVTISLASVLSGASLACVAERYPDYATRIERGAGALMVAGFALLGAALPFSP